MAITELNQSLGATDPQRKYTEIKILGKNRKASRHQASTHEDGLGGDAKRNELITTLTN